MLVLLLADGPFPIIWFAKSLIDFESASILKLNKDPCEKIEAAGIPCGGRELMDNPNDYGVPEGPGAFAPHSGGFFPMYDPYVPPVWGPPQRQPKIKV